MKPQVVNRSVLNSAHTQNQLMLLTSCAIRRPMPTTSYHFLPLLAALAEGVGSSAPNHVATAVATADSVCCSLSFFFTQRHDEQHVSHPTKPKQHKPPSTSRHRSAMLSCMLWQSVACIKSFPASSTLACALIYSVQQTPSRSPAPVTRAFAFSHAHTLPHTFPRFVLQ
jgi:hypothetical protein